VTGENSTAELVGLALPAHAHPSSLEAEVETTDPAEEAADREGIHAASLIGS
jgi:hypothetical protein